MSAPDIMKIILNIESMGQPVTGIGRYTAQLSAGLKKHPDIETVLHFSHYDWDKEPDFSMQAGKAPSDIRRFLRGIPYAYEIRFMVTNLLLSKRLKAVKGYLYHEPNYILAPYDGPCIDTIHDLSHIRYPGYHPRERVSHLEKHLQDSIDRSSHIITVSEFIKKEIIEILGVPGEKVTAIHNGVDESFHTRRRDEAMPILSKYGIADKEYLLTVGTFEPRKNLTGLVNAYSRLPEKIRAKYPLVIAGPKGWTTRPITKVISPIARNGQLQLLGYVPPDDLPFIYAGAHAFAFPSIYEGFGFPPLEAMASGVPVLTSNRTSMPEVASGAALLVDPEDIDGMTDLLKKLLLDEEFRRSAKTAGQKRASEFSWNACIEKTVGVYDMVLNQNAK